MKTKLERIAEVAKEKPNEKFTSLVHLINEEMIANCHKEMVKGKAPGLDLVTKDEYEENLEENISNLIRRMKTNSYKPNPVLRKRVSALPFLQGSIGCLKGIRRHLLKRRSYHTWLRKPGYGRPQSQPYRLNRCFEWAFYQSANGLR